MTPGPPLPRWVYAPALLGAAFILAPFGGDDHPRRLERLPDSDHLGVVDRGSAAEPAHVRGGHRPVPRGGHPLGPGSVARPRTGHESCAVHRPAALGPTPRGGRDCAALHVRTAGSARRFLRSLRHSNRVLHHRCDSRSNLRCHAFPGHQPGRRVADRRDALRERRRDSRGRADHGPATGDTAQRRPRAGLGGRAGIRPGARRVRGHHHLRGEPAGGHPDAAVRIYLQRETDPDAAGSLSLLWWWWRWQVIGLARRHPETL